MAYVLIEHQVGDFEAFRRVYLDDAERRARRGSRGGVVYRVADDPGNVIVVLEWHTLEQAREFAGSLELDQALEWAGSDISTPRVTVLDAAFESSR
jgi:heme-degrading monooxygenase HmoA